MTIPQDIAKIILGITESGGYLKPAARNDAALISSIEHAIAGRIKENRQQLLNFMCWWGERGHIQHLKPRAGFQRAEDWRKCDDPLCLSLYGSALEIQQELEPIPVPAGADSIPA